MKCPRCKGLMFEDRFQDIRDETGIINFTGYRCPNCGEVLDPVILKNRSLGPDGLTIRRRRLNPAGVS